VVASVSWYFLLFKLRIETGVIWRNIYVPSYYHITLLLPKVVANSDADRKQKENLPTKKHQQKQPHSRDRTVSS
jgi:hypothetical protein